MLPSKPASTKTSGSASSSPIPEAGAIYQGGTPSASPDTSKLSDRDRQKLREQERRRREAVSTYAFK